MSVQVNLFKLALVTFVAVSLVVFGDTAGKLLTAQGVGAGLVAWSRFALAAVLLFPFVRVRGRVYSDLAFYNWNHLIPCLLSDSSGNCSLFV